MSSGQAFRSAAQEADGLDDGIGDVEAKHGRGYDRVVGDRGHQLQQAVYADEDQAANRRAHREVLLVNVGEIRGVRDPVLFSVSKVVRSISDKSYTSYQSPGGTAACYPLWSYTHFVAVASVSSKEERQPTTY